MTDGSRIEFTLDELMAIIEDLMRIADDLLGVGDEVNAALVELSTANSRSVASAPSRCSRWRRNRGV